MKSNTDVERTPFAFRLDDHSGVPVYRQLIDQVQGAVASRALKPGDQLITEAVVVRIRSRLGKMRVTGRVDGEIVADGVFTYSMVDLSEMGQGLIGGRIMNLDEVPDDAL